MSKLPELLSKAEELESYLKLKDYIIEEIGESSDSESLVKILNIVEGKIERLSSKKKKNHYLPNGDWKEGDMIYFEMPPFCSGEYEALVYKDTKGLYINQEDNFFEGCRDYRINKKYWK